MDLDELGARLRRQAAQVGMGRAEQQVALTDGGNGLDAFMEVHFPLAVRIGLLPRGRTPRRPGQGLLRRGRRGRGLTEQWCHQMKHEGGTALLATLEALDLTGRSPAAVEETTGW